MRPSGESWLRITTRFNIRKGKDFEFLLLEGKELLTAWYNKLPENEFKVIAVEEPFILTLPDLHIPIVGYIDLIEEDESGTIIVTDHKASGRSYSNDETDKNLQLTIYQLAVKNNGYRNREILLKFDCLDQDQNPQVRELLYLPERNRRKKSDQED